MQVIRFRNHDHPPAHSVMTIGNFDGVHLGHQELIRQVVEEAKEIGAQSVAITFDPHPQVLLRNLQVPMLTSLPQRLDQFERLGLDVACVIPFTPELAEKGAAEFVREYLIENFQARRLIVGYDFAFGHNREGTAQVMDELSAQHDFSFRVLDAVTHSGSVVSSSRIRELLAKGEFDLATKLMGRPYCVQGEVARGPQRGRQIGFPTLNLHPAAPLPVARGVFASRICWRGTQYAGVSNYGVKPTVGSSEALLETHVFDFDQDIYGEQVEITPLRFLREERKFSGLEELKTQIEKDSAQARTILRDHL